MALTRTAVAAGFSSIESDLIRVTWDFLQLSVLKLTDWKTTRLFERTSDLCANLTCILRARLQLGLKVFGLNAEGLLKILGTQSFPRSLGWLQLAAQCRFAWRIPPFLDFQASWLERPQRVLFG
jgi:hypothetical protein